MKWFILFFALHVLLYLFSRVVWLTIARTNKPQRIKQKTISPRQKNVAKHVLRFLSVTPALALLSLIEPSTSQ